MSKTNVSPIYYDSARRGLPFVDEIKELIRYRDLLRLLISASVKTRYKRSSLGMLWTLLNPVLYMTVMMIVFSHLFRFQLPNYPVYLFSGLIAWNFFSQTTIQAMNALIWGSNLMKRVYVPRSIFAAATIGNGIINLLLSCIPLIAIILITHQPITIAWWFVPFGILTLAMFAFGAALILSTIAVFFADMVELYQILLQAGFYLTPIMYPETILPEKIKEFLLFNPIYDVIKLFRIPIYEGHLPSFVSFVAAFSFAVVVLLFGWWLFVKKADQIAYRI